MSENGILEAEQRVREMNRMTRQYSEQGNLYLQSMRNAQNPQNFRQTRFEPAEPYPQGNSGQGDPSANRMRDQQAGSPRGQYSPQSRPQNVSFNRQQNRDQSGQQNSRNRQNNNFPQNCPPNCPPAGDPAGERRNTPGQQNRQQNGQQNNGQQMNSRNGSNFPAADFPPGILPPEEHIRNEIHNGPANKDPFHGFPDLIADNEKLMILLLIYLLMKEKADIKLILALGYLLL